MSEHMFESWNEDEIEHLVEQLEARIDKLIKERDYIQGKYDEECRLYEEMRALLTSHGPEGHNVTNEEYIDLRTMKEILENENKALFKERDELKAKLDKADKFISTIYPKHDWIWEVKK
jgi:chromosome segregation ATPase